MKKLILDGRNLTIKDVIKVARENLQVEIHEESRNEIVKVRDYIEKNWIRSDAPPVYGFNTGVGKLKDYNISMEENDTFQNNIVMSHCGGVGEPASEELVRATMLVRINAFCQGVSGLRMEVIDRLLEILNKGVHPVIPIQGSVGACGDLAPLAHMASVLIGYEEAEAYYEGVKMSAPEALQKAGITPIKYQLKAKDCLALINGTTMFAAMAALNYYDADRIVREAEISGSLSLEAMRGEMAAFDERIHKVRRQKGQIDCASNVRNIVKDSMRVTEKARMVHLKHDVLHPVYQPRVQDLYSLRCMAQVQGACRDNMAYAKDLLEKEINAATDNPLVFWNDKGELEFLSGGNFHGEPIAFAMDIVAMSLAEIGNISERRIFSLCDSALNYGLPPMLVGEPVGLNCGYPVISCAAAALASENKTLCFPASVDTIPTKSNQEDHVSMAPWACRKVKQIINNIHQILGIEYLLAARAIFVTEEHLGRFDLGKGTQIAYEILRNEIEFKMNDSYMPAQSKPAISLAKSGKILDKVYECVSGLINIH
ncbi:HAL/PAL/TAL family ammonia-lyase [Anaeromicrobium sediminis]|uniref:Histidine ammonia-lyase n=1 Tax=Anaeromicrobium sediminis TaxID=1478221 RepID=A0A267MLC9_9FIRM|nr:histidine ammonia-lyase [Anaeromicrobium sediminis]PAB59685.1 histidine ammonia-lyase [Anaeromicrobium sediminis]